MVASDVEKIVAADAETSLQHNPTNCKIISQDIETISHYKIFDQFNRINRDNIRLLGALILKGPAIAKRLREKIDNLNRACNRLSLLYSRDALTLLKNSMRMQKLLSAPHTCECSDNPLLEEFHTSLKEALVSILKVDMNEDQWQQATLTSQKWRIG